MMYIVRDIYQFGTGDDSLFKHPRNAIDYAKDLAVSYIERDNLDFDVDEVRDEIEMSGYCEDFCVVMEVEVVDEDED